MGWGASLSAKHLGLTYELRRISPHRGHRLHSRAFAQRVLSNSRLMDGHGVTWDQGDRQRSCAQALRVAVDHKVLFVSVCFAALALTRGLRFF